MQVELENEADVSTTDDAVGQHGSVDSKENGRHRKRNKNTTVEVGLVK